MNYGDVARCVMMWFYNRSPMQQAQQLLAKDGPDEHVDPAYLNEWVSEAVRGPTAFFGRCDRRNQDWIAAQAVAQYGPRQVEDALAYAEFQRESAPRKLAVSTDERLLAEEQARMPDGGSS